VEGLSDEEIRAFATVFGEPRQASDLLAAAGWAADRVPTWGMTTPREFWGEVSRQLSFGLVHDGRRQLFVAASANYPGNSVFASGAGLLVVRRARLLPPRDLLPARPHPFVRRDRDLDEARKLLCDPSTGQVVAIVGMGGIGKSTLAKDLVRDTAVDEAFPDGIVWIEVGRRPVVAEKVAEALDAFGDPAPVREAAEGTRRLRGLLVGAQALIVLDDVWDVAVLEAFAVPSGVRLLVTTRSQDALFSGAAVHHVVEADDATSRQVLASYAGCGAVGDLPAAAEGILARCSGLVFALAIVGSLVGTGRRPWEYAAKRLRRPVLAAGGLDGARGGSGHGRRRTEISAAFQGYQYRTVSAALDVSVRAFPKPQAQRFRELAIFAGRGAVPEALVVGLWQATAKLDELDAEDLIGQFAANSLLRADPVTRTIRLHDLVYEYVLQELTDEQLRALHRQVAGWLLARWGGLVARVPLPLLLHAAARDEVDSYALRALVGHLLDADDPAAVDQLLEAERPATSGRVESVWYAAHEDQGTTTAYLTSVDAAWRHANALQKPAGRGRVSARQACYALLTGSITSIAAQIPPALLVRLVQAGLWPSARALAYAQAVPDLNTRVQALAGLAPHLPEGSRSAVLAQAVATAMTIDLPFFRAQALAALVSQLSDEESPDVVAQALASAAAVREPSARAEALASVISHLPEDQRGDGIIQALHAAGTAAHGYFQVLGLAALMPHVPDELTGSVATFGFAIASAISNAYFRAQALAELAPYLPEDLLAQALDVVIAIDWPYAQAQGLAALAPYLPDKLLDQALTTVDTIDEPDAQTEGLAGVAPHLPEDQRGPALVRASAAARDIYEPARRAETLALLAPHLPEERRRTALIQALDAARSIDKQYRRAEVLTVLTPRLPDDLLTEALAVATAIDGPRSRAEALTVVAPYLPDSARHVALTQALADIDNLGDPADQAHAITDLAPHLPDHLRCDAVAHALVVIAAIRDSVDQASALVALAPHLSGTLAVEAVAVATAMDDRRDVALVLAALVPCLTDEERHGALAQAFAAFEAIDTAHDRAEALAALAPHLPDGKRYSMLAEGLAVARTIEDRELRAGALTGLAAHLPYDLLADAIAATNTIDWMPGRTQALTALALRLSDDQRAPVLADALAAATAIADPHFRALELAALAPHLPYDRRGAVLAEALIAGGASSRATVINVISAALADDLIEAGAVQTVVAALLRVQRWWP